MNCKRSGLLVFLLSLVLVSALVVAQGAPTPGPCDGANVNNPGCRLKLGLENGNSKEAITTFLSTQVDGQPATSAKLAEELKNVAHLIEGNPTAKKNFADLWKAEETSGLTGVQKGKLFEAMIGASSGDKAQAGVLSSLMTDALGRNFKFSEGKSALDPTKVTRVTVDASVIKIQMGKDERNIPLTNLPEKVDSISIGQDSEKGTAYVAYEAKEGEKTSRVVITDKFHIEKVEGKNRWAVKGSDTLPADATLEINFPSKEKTIKTGEVTIGPSGRDGESALRLAGDSIAEIRYKDGSTLTLAPEDDSGNTLDGGGEGSSMSVNFDKDGFIDLASTGKNVVGELLYKDKDGNKISMKYSEKGPKIDLLGGGGFEGRYSKNGLMLKGKESNGKINSYELEGELGKDSGKFEMNFNGVEVSGKLTDAAGVNIFDGKDTKVEKFAINKEGQFSQTAVVSTSGSTTADGKPRIQPGLNGGFTGSNGQPIAKVTDPKILGNLEAMKEGTISTVTSIAGQSYQMYADKQTGKLYFKDSAGNTYPDMNTVSAGAQAGTRVNAGGCAGGSCNVGYAGGGWWPGKYIFRGLRRVGGRIIQGIGTVGRWVGRAVGRVATGAWRVISAPFRWLFGWGRWRLIVGLFQFGMLLFIKDSKFGMTNSPYFFR